VDPVKSGAVRRRRRVRRLGLAAALVAMLACGGAVAAPFHHRDADVAAPPLSAAPPEPQGYFDYRGAGSWAGLPDDSACATQVHRSSWEPRSVNDKRNHTVPDAEAVHHALAIRPRNTTGAYDPRWDNWLLPRVDGQFRGTTDEILQWAACKWGMPDNLLRSIAVRESTWYQYPTYLSGMCVSNWGCGDITSEPGRATDRFCAGLARFGYDYQKDYGTGVCPKTYSIVGVMAWQAPSWGRMPGNQNGTFPFSRDSTAFAVDYLGGYLRGCVEGWEIWLDHSGAHDYGPGRLWGCVGSWYSGGWHDAAANDYISNVRAAWRSHPWLDVVWPIAGPGCSEQYGCIDGDRLGPTGG
jgi:hypothetical protein